MSPSPLPPYYLTVDHSTDAKVPKPTAIRPYDYWPLFRINLTLLPNLLPLNYIILTTLQALMYPNPLLSDHMTFYHSVESNVPRPLSSYHMSLFLIFSLCVSEIVRTCVVNYLLLQSLLALQFLRGQIYVVYHFSYMFWKISMRDDCKGDGINF